MCAYNCLVDFLLKGKVEAGLAKLQSRNDLRRHGLKSLSKSLSKIVARLQSLSSDLLRSLRSLERSSFFMTNVARTFHEEKAYAESGQASKLPIGHQTDGFHAECSL